MRGDSDPTSHTNDIECLDMTPVNGVMLDYGNVLRHTNTPNPNAIGDLQSIGLLNQYTPPDNSTLFIFNDVVYDTLQNVAIPVGCHHDPNPNPPPTVLPCSSTITTYTFNNTINGDPTWQNIKACFKDDNGSPANYFVNNQCITTAASAFTLNDSDNHTSNTALQTPTAAAAQGYSINSVYAYQPTSASGTTG